MEEFLRYQRQMFLVIAAIAIVVGITLFIIFPSNIQYLYGWLIGSAAGLITYRQRVLAVVNLPSLPQDEWQKAALKSSIAGYACLAVALGAAAMVKEISIYTAAAGLLLERVVLLADGFVRPGALDEAQKACEGSTGQEE